MEKRELLKRKLKAHGMFFEEVSENVILAKVCFRLFLEISFVKEDSIQFKAILKSGNFLTGWFQGGFTSGVFLNSMLLIAAGGLACYEMYDKPILIIPISILLITGHFIFLFWALHHTICLESMKKQIIDWLDL